MMHGPLNVKSVLYCWQTESIDFIRTPKCSTSRKSNRQILLYHMWADEWQDMM